MSTYTAINLIARPAPGPVSADVFEVVQKDMPQAGPGQMLIKQTKKVISRMPLVFLWLKLSTCLIIQEE